MNPLEGFQCGCVQQPRSKAFRDFILACCSIEASILLSIYHHTFHSRCGMRLRICEWLWCAFCLMTHWKYPLSIWIIPLRPCLRKVFERVGWFAFCCMGVYWKPKTKTYLWCRFYNTHPSWRFRKLMTQIFGWLGDFRTKVYTWIHKTFSIVLIMEYHSEPVYHCCQNQ